MPRERVTVEAGGQSFSNWTAVAVGAGAGQAARKFTVVTSEPDQAFGVGWPLRPGTAVKVKAGGDLLVTGYIDDYTPEFGGDRDDAFHRANIDGRSKSKDVIDSSAVHKTGEWKNRTMKEIGDDLLKPFGLTLASDLDDLKKLPVWRLAPGATVFNEIEEMARQAGALIVGTADGGMKLTRADKFKLHAGALREGNIKVGRARLSEKGKHDKVHVRGQKNKGSGKAAHRLENVAGDESVRRYRPLIVIAEGDMDADRIRQRAEWQVRRAAGWSTTAEITVFGWRDENGALWDPEKLVFVESRKLKLSQPLAIKSVNFLQNAEQGTVANLSLVDPKALGGKDAKGKSNDAWNTDLTDYGDGDEE